MTVEHDVALFREPNLYPLKLSRVASFQQNLISIYNMLKWKKHKISYRRAIKIMEILKETNHPRDDGGRSFTGYKIGEFPSFPPSCSFL